MNVSTDLRKCIGSAKFGIEAHEALTYDFPTQPSQKDGLGRMCKPHWTEYTRALRAAAIAKIAPAAAPAPVAEATAVELSPSLRASMNFAAGISRQRQARGKPEPIRTRAPRKVRGTPPGTTTRFVATPKPAQAVDPDAQEVGVE